MNEMKVNDSEMSMRSNNEAWPISLPDKSVQRYPRSTAKQTHSL